MKNLSTVKLNSKLIASQNPLPNSPTFTPKIAEIETNVPDTVVETSMIALAANNETNTIKQVSKQSELMELMHRPEGLALSELMKLTQWQAHSIRGWISGVLRKKLGLVVTRLKSNTGETCYRIESATVVSD